MMECTRNADQAEEAISNTPVIENGRMKISKLPGLGLDLDQDYLKATKAEGEP